MKMSAKSKKEAHFERLLNQCELMVSQGSVEKVKIEQYVECVEKMLLELNHSPINVSTDNLEANSNRVLKLKRFLSDGQWEACVPSEQKEKDKLLNEGKCNRETRNELLGTDNRGVRYRGNVTSEDDLDALMKHHQNMQDKIAEEMVSLARSLKDTTLIAGKIVRDDTERLEKSGKLADQNYGRLKLESERLEKHTSRACNWWVWMMLIIVCCTFVGMVMFMRLFSKS